MDLSSVLGELRRESPASQCRGFAQAPPDPQTFCFQLRAEGGVGALNGELTRGPFGVEQGGPAQALQVLHLVVRAGRGFTGPSPYPAGGLLPQLVHQFRQIQGIATGRTHDAEVKPITPDMVHQSLTQFTVGQHPPACFVTASWAAIASLASVMYIG